MTKRTLPLLEIKILLEPMGNVVFIIQDNSMLIKKDEIVFGKINKDKIYLIDNTGTFKPVGLHILKKPDEFLQKATNAYWAASGNKPTATLLL